MYFLNKFDDKRTKNKLLLKSVQFECFVRNTFIGITARKQKLIKCSATIGRDVRMKHRLRYRHSNVVWYWQSTTVAAQWGCRPRPAERTREFPHRVIYRQAIVSQSVICVTVVACLRVWCRFLCSLRHLFALTTCGGQR